MAEESIKSDSTEYHLTILRMMINQLSPEVASLLSQQLDKVCQSILAELDQSSKFWTQIKNHLRIELSDLQSNVNYMQFDLEATRRERDQLQAELDNSSDNK